MRKKHIRSFTVGPRSTHGQQSCFHICFTFHTLEKIPPHTHTTKAEVPIRTKTLKRSFILIQVPICVVFDNKHRGVTKIATSHCRGGGEEGGVARAEAHKPPTVSGTRQTVRPWKPPPTPPSAPSVFPSSVRKDGVTKQRERERERKRRLSPEEEQQQEGSKEASTSAPPHFPP